MIYLIGLGLYFEVPESILNRIKGYKKYVDVYTSYVPGDVIRRYELTPVDRVFLEEKVYELLDQNIAIFVAGDPMFATTHSSIYFESIQRGIQVKVYHNSSIFNVISRTGLSPYRFGRVVSIASWANDNVRSYLDYIEKNKAMDLHTLVLPDPAFQDTEQFFSKIDLGEDIFVLSRIGFDDERIAYGKIYSKKPFSIIIPAKLSHYEEEYVEILKSKS